MLHRAGNVDGEGDGCGVMIDIPRAIWQEEVRQGGHAPKLALDPTFAVAHVFVSRKDDFEPGQARRARRSSTAAASGVLAEREDQVDSSALGPTAREEEPHFWQVGGAGSRRRRRATAILFDVAIELEEQLDAARRLLLGGHAASTR